MDTQRTVNFYLDIETYAGSHKPSLDEIDAPSNYKDEAKILAYKEENLDKVYRKQALDSMKGQIICVSFAVNDDPVQTIMETDEKELMGHFNNVISEYPWAILIGHNILRFDLPWLYHRAIKYNLSSLKSIIPHSKNDTAMVRDTLNMFAGTAFTMSIGD